MLQIIKIYRLWASKFNIYFLVLKNRLFFVFNVLVQVLDEELVLELDAVLVSAFKLFKSIIK